MLAFGSRSAGSGAATPPSARSAGETPEAPAASPARSRRRAVGALAALVLVVGSGCALLDDEPGEALPAGHGTVVRVVDGDTVEVRIDGTTERVRMIGIDTPETVAPDRPVDCFGPEASQRTKDLLPEGTEVRLERDVEPRDRYGRLLAYVVRAQDELHVNRALVEGGFAEARRYEPNVARQAELDAAEASARSAQRGLWAACAGAEPVASAP